MRFAPSSSQKLQRSRTKSGDVKEYLNNLGRKFGVYLFPILEVALAHLVSNATPLDNVPTTPKVVL